MKKSIEHDAKSIVKRLEGHWHGNYGLCRCPAHADKTPSLSISIGRTAVLFHCFAGCEQRDILIALKRLRISADVRSADYSTAKQTSKTGDNSARAREMWSKGTSVNGTLGETYLKSRHIYHAAPFCRFAADALMHNGTRWIHLPALLLPISTSLGIVAIQRIFLSGDGHKADIESPKRCLGLPGGGAIRYGKAPDTHLNIAEGFEDAVSVCALQGLDHCWAAAGIERYTTMEIPAQVKTITIWSQHGAPATKAVKKAETKFTGQGHQLSIEIPAREMDWNDMLVDIQERAF
jgi:putative DNA primase/helicase